MRPVSKKVCLNLKGFSDNMLIKSKHIAHGLNDKRHAVFNSFSCIGKNDLSTNLKSALHYVPKVMSYEMPVVALTAFF